MTPVESAIALWRAENPAAWHDFEVVSRILDPNRPPADQAARRLTPPPANQTIRVSDRAMARIRSMGRPGPIPQPVSMNWPGAAVARLKHGIPIAEVLVEMPERELRHCAEAIACTLITDVLAATLAAAQGGRVRFHVLDGDLGPRVPITEPARLAGADMPYATQLRLAERGDLLTIVVIDWVKPPGIKGRPPGGDHEKQRVAGLIEVDRRAGMWPGHPPRGGWVAHYRTTKSTYGRAKRQVPQK